MTENAAEQAASDEFEATVRTVLNEIGDMLIAKNKAYGDSALNPVRIFSQADAVEQLKVRIDDKISRLMRGRETEKVPEATVDDLIGYLVLLKIAERQ